MLQLWTWTIRMDSMELMTRDEQISVICNQSAATVTTRKRTGNKWPKKGSLKTCEQCGKCFVVKNVRFSRTCGRKCAAALRVESGTNGNRERVSWQSKLITWVKRVNKAWREGSKRCPQCGRRSAHSMRRCNRCCSIISHASIMRIRKQVKEMEWRFAKKCKGCKAIAEFQSAWCAGCNKQRAMGTRNGNPRMRCKKYGGQYNVGVSIEAVVKRDGIRCKYCGIKTTRWQGIWTPTLTTLDHVVPLSKRGDHSMQNVVIACGACNVKKSNKCETLF